MDCIFCKIIAGEIPAYKVYENERVLAFLDINAKTYGHTLVIPKKHYRDIIDLNNSNENYLQDITEISKLLTNKLGAQGLNIINNCGSIAGQEVFHVHFHLIPQYEDITINEQKLEFATIIEKINE